MSNIRSLLCGILALALMLGGCANAPSESTPAPVSSSSVNEASELELERLKAEKEREEAEAKAQEEAEAEEKANAESLEWKQAYYDYVKEYILKAKKYDTSNLDASLGSGDSSINAVSLVDIYGDGVPTLFLWCTYVFGNTSGSTTSAYCKYWTDGELIDPVDPTRYREDGTYHDGIFYTKPSTRELALWHSQPRSMGEAIDIYENGKWNNIYTLVSDSYGWGVFSFTEFGKTTEFRSDVVSEEDCLEKMNDYLADFEQVDLQEYKINFPEVEKEGYVDWSEAAPTIAALFNSFDDRDNFEAGNATEEAAEISRSKWRTVYINWVKEFADMYNSNRDSYDDPVYPISSFYLMDVNYDNIPELLLCRSTGPDLTITDTTDTSFYNILSYEQLLSDEYNVFTALRCEAFPTKFYQNVIEGSIMIFCADSGYNSGSSHDVAFLQAIDMTKLKEIATINCYFTNYEGFDAAYRDEIRANDDKFWEFYYHTENTDMPCDLVDNNSDFINPKTAEFIREHLLYAYAEMDAPPYYEFGTGLVHKHRSTNDYFSQQPVIDWIQEVADNW